VDAARTGGRRIGAVARRSKEMGVPDRRPGGAGRHLPASDVRRAGTALRPLWLRYCQASELDLMVRLGGLRLRERYQDWVRGPFTGESQDHIWV
jgi:hypothetical protein